jgi:hypothetical protein
MIRAVRTCPFARVFSNIREPIVNIAIHGLASSIFGVVAFGSIGNNAAVFYSQKPMA